MSTNELPNPSISEKMRLRHYYGYMRLRFNADGTVDGQKGRTGGCCSPAGSG